VPSEFDISLNIRNNRNYAQTFNGMGGSVNPLDTSNATTEYRYNITTFNFTDENSITIYYKSVGQSVFSSFTAELPSQNPEGLVIALNGLGIGFFNTYVELGQTFLGTYNENYIFGSLDVYNSSIPTTTTTSTSTTTTTIFVPTTTTTSTTSTTTSLAPTTSTTSTTTSLAPTTTSTTTTTTSLAPTTTSTTTSTTTEAATTTSTTTSTTTEAATTTSTTTSTTTEAATTTSTTTSTTTEAATTTSTTSTTTTLEPTTTTTSTTSTTTTLEPTTTTTSTTTTTTTLEPTTTTTSTTTTTTTLAFSGSVGYSGNDATVCFTPVATFTMTGNAGSFCASTIFTSASWGAVASGAYFIAFGGNILPVNHVLGENTATTSGACTACPITTTTTTTTSTSTTSTSTTSTTTTLPPVTLSLTPGCAGGPGLGTILANNFSGGTGSFEYISISATSEAEALTNLDNPATRTFINGATEYTFTTLANSTYYVAIMDFSGNKGVNSTSVLCTTTTTTTSTTTTTTTAAPVAYTIDNGANGNPYGACVGSVPTSVVYAEPGNTVPIVGLILYTNQNLTTPFVGSAGWRKLVQGVTSYAAEVNSSGEITNYVTCTSQTTTTTTSTTTSTTTLPGIAFGVSINTKYGTEFLACGGTITGIRYQPPAFGNVPTNGAQLYTDSTLQTTWTPAEGAGLYLFQFGGSTKWAVFVGATGLVGAVSACSGVTTTTTTTTTSTTSTTTTIPIYTYLGNTNPIYSTFSAACQNYATIRPYYSTKSNLNLIGPTDIIYDSYPGSPTNGGNLWVALTSGGVDPKLGFQIGTDGAVITSGGNCPVLTTTTTTSSTTTTTTITTSTTTTTTTSLAPFADVVITNNFFQGNITDVTVAGVTVSGISFPVFLGNVATGTTTEIGLTQTIIIYYDNVLAGSRIEYTDGETGNFCDNISGGGSITWSAADVVDGGTITITAGDGSCP
jgi:hypothetical protein